MPSVVALIPARSGSKRVPDKNARVLGGHPLMAYTIEAARASGVFDTVVCSTDTGRLARIAYHYGAEIPFLRPAEFASSTSPDRLAVTHSRTISRYPFRKSGSACTMRRVPSFPGREGS